MKCFNTATWLQGLPYSPFTTGGPWHWVPCSYSGTAPREAPLTFLTPLQVGGPCGGRENGSHGTQALSVPQQRAPRTMGVQCCSLTIRLPAIRLRTGPSSNGNSLWGRQQLIRLTGARRSPVSPFPWCGPRLPSLKHTRMHARTHERASERRAKQREERNRERKSARARARDIESAHESESEMGVYSCITPLTVWSLFVVNQSVHLPRFRFFGTYLPRALTQCSW